MFCGSSTSDLAKSILSLLNSCQFNKAIIFITILMMSQGEIYQADLSCFLKHLYQGGSLFAISHGRKQREALYLQNNVLRVSVKMYYFVSFLIILLFLISVPSFHFLFKGFAHMDVGIVAHVYSGLRQSETNRISCNSRIKSQNAWQCASHN